MPLMGNSFIKAELHSSVLRDDSAIERLVCCTHLSSGCIQIHYIVLNQQKVRVESLGLLFELGYSQYNYSRPSNVTPLCQIISQYAASRTLRHSSFYLFACAHPNAGRPLHTGE
jgi:hypothetical protein